jgi:hypothetical protein
VLKKTEDNFSLFEVKFHLLDKIRPLIDQAKEIEKTVHRKEADEKAANWMLKAAQDAELELDEDMQIEIAEKLGSKAAKGDKSALLKGSRLKEFAYDDSIHRRRDNKAVQKEKALKAKYD